MGMRDQMGDFGGSRDKDETYKLIIPRKGVVEVPKVNPDTKQSPRVFFRVLDIFSVYHGVRFWVNSGLTSNKPGKGADPIEIPFMSDQPYKDWLGNQGRFLYRNDGCMLSQLAQKGSPIIGMQRQRQRREQEEESPKPKIEHVSALSVQILRASPSSPRNAEGKRVAPYIFDVDEKPYLWEFKGTQWARFLNVIDPKEAPKKEVDALGEAQESSQPKKAGVEEYAKQKGIPLDQIVFCVYRKLDDKFEGNAEDQEFAAPFKYDYVQETKLSNPTLPPKSAWVDISRAYRVITQEELKSISSKFTGTIEASAPSAAPSGPIAVPAPQGASSAGVTPLAQGEEDEWGK